MIDPTIQTKQRCMVKCYSGKILTVNLTTGEIKDELIPDNVYENLLSGVGLGAYVLYNRIPAGADPLGPENILGFVSGLLTGSTAVLYDGNPMYPSVDRLWQLAEEHRLTSLGDARSEMSKMYRPARPSTTKA